MNPSIEPMLLVRGKPASESPNLLIPPKIASAKLERMRTISPNPDSAAYWNNILQGGLGTDRPAVISPSFRSASTRLRNETGGKDDAIELPHKENFGEGDLQGFGDLEWNKKERRWELQTDFVNEDKFILCTRDCFFDADGTACELFLKWENQHPKLAKKFALQISPKDKPKHKKKKKKNDKDEHEKHWKELN